MHKTIRIWKMWKVLCFLVCLFFSLYMYTNNTNSLIIVGATLTKKKQRALYTIRFFHWFNSFSLKIWHFFKLFFFFLNVKIGSAQPDWPNSFESWDVFHSLSCSLWLFSSSRCIWIGIWNRVGLCFFFFKIIGLIVEK